MKKLILMFIVSIMLVISAVGVNAACTNAIKSHACSTGGEPDNSKCTAVCGSECTAQTGCCSSNAICHKQTNPTSFYCECFCVDDSCDDGNECTNDQCTNGVCQNTIVPGKDCEDGDDENPCTGKCDQYGECYPDKRTGKECAVNADCEVGEYCTLTDCTCIELSGPPSSPEFSIVSIIIALAVIGVAGVVIYKRKK
jgi:hypothetical protein